MRHRKHSRKHSRKLSTFGRGLRTGLIIASVALVLLTAPSLAAPPLQAQPPVSPATIRLTLEPLTDALQLPVSVTHDGRGNGLLYIVQLGGLVRVWDPAASDGAGALREAPFLDLRGIVSAMEGEDGFYAIAFHPDFQSVGRVYAAYTKVGSHAMRITEYHTNEARTTADVSTERVLLSIDVDEPFHHGGGLAFGPDGYLYIGTGDGQEQNHWLHEPPFVAQDLSTLRGKVLRIDVDSGEPYTVPHDNPFVGREGARAEVFASGFRNPWKLGFDRLAGDLYVSDVGNDRWEEIDRVEAGGNYGWPVREGPECQAYPDTPGYVDPACEDLDFVAPIASYGHPALDPQGGNAVVGGFVYRGADEPALEGRYLFSDFVSGRFWSLADPAGPDPRLELLLDTDMAISAIGEGGDGELYALSMAGGLYRIKASKSAP